MYVYLPLLELGAALELDDSELDGAELGEDEDAINKM